MEVRGRGYKASFKSYKWLHELRGSYPALLNPFLLDSCPNFLRQAGGTSRCLQPLLSQGEVSQLLPPWTLVHPLSPGLGLLPLCSLPPSPLSASERNDGVERTGDAHAE